MNVQERNRPTLFTLQKNKTIRLNQKQDIRFGDLYL